LLGKIFSRKEGLLHEKPVEDMRAVKIIKKMISFLTRIKNHESRIKEEFRIWNIES